MTVTGVDLGDLTLDFVRLEATWRGRVVPLSHRELVVLYWLADVGGFVPGPLLARLVYGLGSDEDRRRLSLLVGRIAEKAPGLVRTVRCGHRPGEYVLATNDEKESAA